MELVERIQFCCNNEKISIKQLERDLSIANGSIRRWNTSIPSCDKVIKISEYFGISIDWLLTGNNQTSILISKEERILLSSYNHLSESQKDCLQKYIEVCLISSKEFQLFENSVQNSDLSAL